MKTAINLINLKECHANFKALSVLNLARMRDVAPNLKRVCREKSNLARSRGASIKFTSPQGRDLNFILCDRAAQNFKKGAYELA